ncbi:FAD binding domain containing protein [Amanita muscaria]
MKPRILIIGAGPSGSVLALALLHHNIPVRIIESSTSHPYIQWHSSSLLPRCLELFTMLGFVDDVLEQAIRVPTMQHYKSSDRTQVDIEVDMSPHTEPTPASPFLHALLLSQSSLKKIIRAALVRKGCTVEKGTELVSFTQTPEKVNVKLAKRNGTQIEYEEESYDWMVGADGSAASICHQLGFEFHGDAEICKMLMGEVYMEGVDPRSWHIWGTKPPENHVSLRAIEKPGYFSVNVNGERVDAARLSGNTDLLRRFLQEATGNRADLKFGDILWSSVYHPDSRLLTRFLEGRVLVMGVATSLIPPQALTSAVQDACNLAWKLALVHKRIGPYSLLNSYSEERLPVIAQMIDMTFQQDRIPFEEKKGRDEVRKNSYDQLGVNCRWSSIVFDERKKDTREDEENYHFDISDDEEEEEEEVLDAYGLEIDGTLTAGDRAPDAPGLIDMRDTRKTTPSPKTWRLFQLFGPCYHTVLVFVGATRRWASVLRFLSSYPKGLVYTALISRRGNLVPAADASYADFAFEDRNGHAHDVYVYDDKYGIVIVRPDGVVGAIVKGTEGIEWYFHGIFAQRKRN